MTREQTDKRLKEIKEQVEALAAEAEQLIKDEIKDISRIRRLVVKNLWTLDIKKPSGEEVEDERIEHLILSAYRDIFGRDMNNFIIKQGKEE